MAKLMKPPFTPSMVALNRKHKPALRVTGRRLMLMLVGKCAHKRSEPHTCPYLVEVLDDKRTKCRCCDKCQELCTAEL